MRPPESAPHEPLSWLRPGWLPLTALVYAGLGIFSLYWLRVLTPHPVTDDFQIYYSAYQAAASGANPYLPYHIGTSFLYPPPALSLIGLFAWVDNFTLARAAWTFASLTCWAGCLVMVYSLLGATHDSSSRCSRTELATLIGIAFLFAPFWETVTIGQINTFVAFFLYASLVLSDRRPMAAGSCLAIATSLKVFPVLLVLYFLAVSKPRVVIGFLLSMVVLLLVALLQFSPSLGVAYLEILPRLTAELHATVYNQSVLATVTRLLDRLDLYEYVPLVTVLLKLSFVTLLIPLLLTGRSLSQNARATQIWLFFSVATISVLLSPTVWYHYSTLLLPPIALLLMRRSTAGPIAAILTLVLVQSCRLLEHVAILLPVSVVVGHLILLGAVTSIYFAEWMSHTRTVRVRAVPVSSNGFARSL